MSGTAKAYVFENFDETKKVEGTPQGCLWGFYDEDGKKDQVGCMLQILAWSSNECLADHTPQQSIS